MFYNSSAYDSVNFTFSVNSSFAGSLSRFLVCVTSVVQYMLRSWRLHRAWMYVRFKRRNWMLGSTSLLNVHITYLNPFTTKCMRQSVGIDSVDCPTDLETSFSHWNNTIYDCTPTQEIWFRVPSVSPWGSWIFQKHSRGSWNRITWEDVGFEPLRDFFIRQILSTKT